jgi:hypothetical protein
VQLTALSKFVRWAGFYNLALALGMAVPMVPVALGINIVDPVLGR